MYKTAPHKGFFYKFEESQKQKRRKNEEMHIMPLFGIEKDMITTKIRWAGNRIKNNNKCFKGYSAIALLILILCIILSGCGEKEIGSVYGFEHQYLKIGSDTYTECANPGVNIAWDKNKKLGKAYFGDTSDPFIIWSVKGYDDYEYLYTTWVYEGSFYKKDPVNEAQSEKE